MTAWGDCKGDVGTVYGDCKGDVGTEWAGCGGDALCAIAGKVEVIEFEGGWTIGYDILFGEEVGDPGTNEESIVGVKVWLNGVQLVGDGSGYVQQWWVGKYYPNILTVVIPWDAIFGYGSPLPEPGDEITWSYEAGAGNLKLLDGTEIKSQSHTWTVDAGGSEVEVPFEGCP